MVLVEIGIEVFFFCGACMHMQINVCAHTEATGQCWVSFPFGSAGTSGACHYAEVCSFLKVAVGTFKCPTWLSERVLHGLFTGRTNMAYSSMFPQLRPVSVYQIPRARKCLVTIDACHLKASELGCE